MARIKGTDRLVRLLESEGGSLGRCEITEALGFTDARHEELAAQLVAKKVVAKDRGRTGGLRLVSSDLPSEEREAPLERDAGFSDGPPPREAPRLACLADANVGSPREQPSLWAQGFLTSYTGRRFWCHTIWQDPHC